MIYNNTIQNKIKWFASYLGADIEIKTDNGNIIEKLTPTNLSSIESKNIDAKLILKPIESISDDLIEIIEEELDILDFRDLLGDFSFCIYRWDLPHTVDLINFLKFNGYCVEWNPKRYIKFGWLKPMK